MVYRDLDGVPDFESAEYAPKQSKYCLLIPILNEKGRIDRELQTAREHGIPSLVDIVICDGGSTDGCTEAEQLKALGVNTLLTKTGPGKQGAQLRMGFWWALQRGYEGFITVDGNNKDSVEDIPAFIQKLDEGYDFVQGSRFIKGGRAVNTPPLRYFAVRLIHAPIISITARKWFTDTTNAFRAHSKKYITHPQVQPFRDVFAAYELLAYLSVKASRLGLRTCEIPVTRAYPKHGKTPTKIQGFQGNKQLFMVLLQTARGKYDV